MKFWYHYFRLFCSVLIGTEKIPYVRATTLKIGVFIWLVGWEEVFSGLRTPSLQHYVWRPRVCQQRILGQGVCSRSWWWPERRSRDRRLVYVKFMFPSSMLKFIICFYPLTGNDFVWYQCPEFRSKVNLLFFVLTAYLSRSSLLWYYSFFSLCLFPLPESSTLWRQNLQLDRQADMKEASIFRKLT